MHARADVGGFTFTHKSYTHDFAQTWHEHPAGSIDFVLDGGGEGVYHGREVRSRPGLVEFFRDGVRHKFVSGARGIRSMHVVIPAGMLREIDGLRDLVVEELDHTRAVGLASRVLAELTAPDRSSGLVMESLAHELLDEVSGAIGGARRRSGWVGGVRDYLHDRRDRSVSLDELSGVAGVSKGQLARGFKGTVGMTTGEYHRRVRVAHAARELAETDATIARVARGAGFADQAHFTRVFGELYGVTPGVFRASLRG